MTPVWKKYILLENPKYFDFGNGLWTGKRPPFKSVNVIRNTNFTSSGKIDYSDVAVLEVESKQFEDKRLMKGDIIIERSGGGPKQPVGRVVYFDRNEDNFSFSNFTSRVRVINDGFDSKFVFYTLMYFYQEGNTFEMQAQTTGIRNLDFTKYKSSVRIPYIEVIEQRKITYILDMLQKAIDHQDRLLHNTFKLKKALMNKLFSEGTRGEKQKQTEIGMVPSSWKVKKVGAVADVTSGGTPSRKEKEFWLNGTIPWVKTGEVNYCVINCAEEYITELGLKNSSTKLYPNGTLLMAMYGQGITRGKVAILGIEATINQACGAITPKNKNELLSEYLYYFFENNYDYVRNLGHGANQKNLSGALIKAIEISFPNTIEEQESIIATFKLLDRRINVRKEKKRTLIVLFRTLLHELITGQKRLDKIQFEILNKKYKIKEPPLSMAAEK
jgi:type I restriction enzyme S subunit